LGRRREPVGAEGQEMVMGDRIKVCSMQYENVIIETHCFVKFVFTNKNDQKIKKFKKSPELSSQTFFHATSVTAFYSAG
jgi:hypothetical protein